MKPEKNAKELLHWRLEQARAEAPQAPSASRLLELARPWWEKWPEKFQAQVEHLRRIQVGYKGPATEPSGGLDGYAVPALIVRGVEESEGWARVLEFKICGRNLHFRFQMQPPLTLAEPTLELTFIANPDARPLFFAEANGLVESEFLLDTVLLPKIARDWAHLKERDRLPFRLILH